MNNLFLNWVVFDSLLVPVNGNILHIFFLKDLWNVLSLVFNGIIIRHLSFPWHIGNVFLFFVLYHCSLIRHVLDSRFPFNGCLGHCCNWRNRCDHRLNWDRCH
jgi:hypothetical protein